MTGSSSERPSLGESLATLWLNSEKPFPGKIEPLLHLGSGLIDPLLDVRLRWPRPTSKKDYLFAMGFVAGVSVTSPSSWERRIAVVGKGLQGDSPQLVFGLAGDSGNVLGCKVGVLPTDEGREYLVANIPLVVLAAETADTLPPEVYDGRLGHVRDLAIAVGEILSQAALEG